MNPFAEIAIQQVRSEMQMHFDAVILDKNNQDTEFEKRIKRVRGFFEAFDHVMANMPECLDIELIDLNSVNGDTKKRKEKQFDNGIKRDFLSEMAKRHPKAFENMGVKGDYLLHIQEEGTVPYHPDDGYYDITVDHIIELSLGGSNDWKNLSVIPEFLNICKTKFFHNQLRAGAKNNAILIVPKKFDDRPNAVPFIPGGFRQKQDHAALQTRSSELFGYDLVSELLI